MLRILRAFAWLRWRILLNSLERQGSRDVIERFSLAIEQLGPVIVALVMVPSALTLAGAGAYAGWALARGDSPVLVLQLLRFLLFAGCVVAVVGPIMLPAGDRTNAVRFLLLPIPRPVLYLAQAMSALADPWVLLVAVVAVAMPLGIVAGGAPIAALAGLGAGLLLLATLAGLSLLVTGVIHVVVRDRRRGEILTLILILILPIAGMLPAVFATSRSGRGAGRAIEVRGPREAAGWSQTAGRAALTVVPSEAYTRAVRTATRSEYAAALPPLLILTGTAAGLHGIAFLLFVRILNSPAMLGGGRRASQSGAAKRLRLPGLSPSASAMAINQLRLALRTPRGRSSILSPLVVFFMFALITVRNTGGIDLGFLRFGSGLALAAFASFVSLLSIIPLAMNQFAIDRAGLTLTLLAPLETRAILAGKAIGNALIAGIPALVCLACAGLLFARANPSLWLSLPFALVATYLPVAPVAAVLSALFPRAVDLNSISRGSNAHAAASLLGVLAFVLSALPNVLLILFARGVLGRPGLAPLFVFGWLLVSAGLSVALFVPAAAIFERRRENLGLVV